MRDSLFKELVGLRRESVCCTLHPSALWSNPDWPWRLSVGWHSAHPGLWSAAVCLMRLRVHRLIGFAGNSNQDRASWQTVSLALHQSNLYALHFVYKICRFGRTLLSKKMDLIFLNTEHHGNVAALPNPPKRLGSLFLFDPCPSCDLRLGCKQAVMQRDYQETYNRSRLRNRNWIYRQGDRIISFYI